MRLHKVKYRDKLIFYIKADDDDDALIMLQIKPIQLPRVIEGGVWIYDLQPPGPLPLLILPTSNGNGAPPSPPTGNRSGAGTFRLSTPILGAGNRKGKSTRYQTRCPPLPMVRHWLSKRFPQETLCCTPRAWNIGTKSLNDNSSPLFACIWFPAGTTTNKINKKNISSH